MDSKKDCDQSPLIETLDLSKQYKQKDGIVQALDQINLTIAKRDIYGIIGLSGAGKSTLLRCLAGLISPSSGKVLFQNSDISSLKGPKLREFYLKIGMIFQHFNLFSSRTVAENVAYPLEIAKVSKLEQKKRAHELLGLVGLSSKKMVYPSSLSGGEKQRVGIARALANHPDVLFCDEATSALDPRTTQDILTLLKRVNQKLGVTIVLITHDMEVIKKVCNKVAVIEGGQIVEKGTVAEVFSDPNHPTTKQFIQGSSHEIPEEFFKNSSSERKLLRLRFKGSSASEPLISQIVKKYHVDANILLGWVDYLQTTTVGTLIIELMGKSDAITQALTYLTEKSVQHEVLINPNER